MAGSRRPGPGIEPPADIDPRDLAPEVRSQLRTLSKAAADGVARHLVAAGRLVDEDPQSALQHARAARALASRVAVVREAVGETAYAAGEWAEAIAELRTARRMTGDDSALPMIADSERALGRADRALRLAQSEEAQALAPADRAEMRIVEAGARRDLGQLDAAVLTLQDAGLDRRTVEPWSARIWYAYADLLLDTGREDEAREWFVAAAGADREGSTDADERLLQLDGIEILADEDEDEDEFDPDADAELAEADEEMAPAGLGEPEAGPGEPEAGLEGSEADLADSDGAFGDPDVGADQPGESGAGLVDSYAELDQPDAGLDEAEAELDGPDERVRSRERDDEEPAGGTATGERQAGDGGSERAPDEGQPVGREVPGGEPVGAEAVGDESVRAAPTQDRSGAADPGAPVRRDAESKDAESKDMESADAGLRDTGPVDVGPVDVGPVDVGPVDVGPVDVGPVDVGPVDVGPVDVGPVDVGPVDVGPAGVVGSGDGASAASEGTSPITLTFSDRTSE